MKHLLTITFASILIFSLNPQESRAGMRSNIAKIITKGSPYYKKYQKIVKNIKKIKKHLRKKVDSSYDKMISDQLGVPGLAREGGAVSIAMRIGFEDPQTQYLWIGNSKGIRKHNYTPHPLIKQIYDDRTAWQQNSGKCAEVMALSQELRYLEANGHTNQFNITWYEPNMFPYNRARTKMLLTLSMARWQPKRSKGGRCKRVDKAGCEACKNIMNRLGIIDLNQTYSKKELTILILKSLGAVGLQSGNPIY